MTTTDGLITAGPGDGPQAVPELLRELARRGAAGMPHLGGHALEHLRGVHRLLVTWQNPAWVCAAGLFHSFYGTDRLDHALGAETERAVVRGLLGSQGEALVWCYCACEFPLLQASLLSADAPRYRDRRSGQFATVPAALLPALCELLVANEMELAIGSATYREKKRGLLEGIVRQRGGLLSAGAAAAVRRLMAVPAAVPAG
jgi:hypothetical protein